MNSRQLGKILYKINIKSIYIQIKLWEEIPKGLILLEDEKVFNSRVAALIEHEGKVLIQTTPRDDFWVLSDGSVKHSESCFKAIAKERRGAENAQVKI